ncbi:hypothetical protein K438DRAFT_1991879 [Mycena galopus ATCC 62051]|nr:hypothetical protein K438DRAFT_1991879 [Mycena galopus ATCC 62051]
MSTLYVPLSSNIAASFLAALSVPGASLDPILAAELRTQLTAALSGPGSSNLPALPSDPGPLSVASSHITSTHRRTFAPFTLPEHIPQIRAPGLKRGFSRSSSVPLEIDQQLIREGKSYSLAPFGQSLTQNPSGIGSKCSLPQDLLSSPSENAPRKLPRVTLKLGPKPRTPESSDDEGSADCDTHTHGGAGTGAGQQVDEDEEDADGTGQSGGEEMVEGEGTSKKGKKQKLRWRVDPEGGPPLTLKAGHVLARLLGILTTSSRRDLEELLTCLPVTESTLAVASTLDGAVERVQQLHVGLHQHELNYMLALIQLTVHVDRAKKEAALQGLPKVTGESLVACFASRVARRTFLDWLSSGQKLMLVAAAGTMYILPILAALDMRTVITRQCSEEDILSVACALRQTKHGQWLPLVRRLMVPLNHLHKHPSSGLSSMRIYFKDQGDTDTDISSYTFDQIEKLDNLFSEIETHYPRLPVRSKEWNNTSIDAWLPYPISDPPSTITIQTPFTFKKLKLPFTQDKRDTFTNKERVKAAKAEVATSITDLDTKLKSMHAGGKRKRDQYIGINTSIAGRKPLFIRDVNKKLLSLAFKMPDHIKQALYDAIILIQAAMPGKFQDVNSMNALFQFLSCHYTWYARFAENGSGAPPDEHPFNIRKDHDQKVNHEQRFPHQAKLCRENREEFLMLAQAYENLFEWLRPQVL